MDAKAWKEGDMADLCEEILRLSRECATTAALLSQREEENLALKVMSIKLGRRLLEMSQHAVHHVRNFDELLQSCDDEDF